MPSDFVLNPTAVFEKLDALAMSYGGLHPKAHQAEPFAENPNHVSVLRRGDRVVTALGVVMTVYTTRNLDAYLIPEDYHDRSFSSWANPRFVTLTAPRAPLPETGFANVFNISDMSPNYIYGDVMLSEIYRSYSMNEEGEDELRRRQRFAQWKRQRDARLRQARDELARKMAPARQGRWWWALGDRREWLDLRNSAKNKGRRVSDAVKLLRTSKDEGLKLASMRVLFDILPSAYLHRHPQATCYATFRNRLLQDEWQSPVWSGEEWYQSHPASARLCHVSTEDAQQVAYIDSVDKMERELFTRCKPGRFLTKFFSDVLSEAEIKRWAERQTLYHDTRTKMKFVENDNPEGWEWVYENASGFSSCMMYDHPESRYIDSDLYGVDHPVRAYAYKGNGLRLAYIGDDVGTPGGRVYARAIVRDEPRTKGYVRIYGDERLKVLLEKEGYGEKVGLRGVKLVRREHPCDDDLIICPYLDSGEVEVHEGYLLVVSDGIDSTSEGCISYEEHSCPRCGATLGSGDETNYNDHVGDYCDNCEDLVEAIVGVSSSGYRFTEMVEESETIEIDGDTYLEDSDLLRRCGFAQCEECDEWVESDDLTETSRGPVCSCTDTVELDVEDPYGNKWACTDDAVEAVRVSTGKEVMIHEDMLDGEEFMTPEDYQAWLDEDEAKETVQENV